MDEVDPLVSAVSEVSSVANQLREIKRKVEQYGQASARLDQVSSAVSQLATAVTGVQGEFEKLLLTAKEVLVTAEQQRSDVAATAAGIPEIVQRIEASDASQRVGQFIFAITEFRDQLDPQIASLVSLQNEMVHRGKDQGDALDGLGAGIKHITSDVAALRVHVEGGVPNTRVLAKLDELLAVLTKHSDEASERGAVIDKAANYALRTAQMSAELGKRVIAMQTVLDSHTKMLQVIKDKKGLVF